MSWILTEKHKGIELTLKEIELEGLFIHVIQNTNEGLKYVKIGDEFFYSKEEEEN